MFVVVFLGLAFAADRIDVALGSPGLPENSIAALLRSQLLTFVPVVLANAIMLIIWREPLHRVGLGARRHALRDMALGAAAGLGLLAALLIAIAIAGGGGFGAVGLGGSDLLGYGLGWLLMFAIVSVSEEGLMRAYPLVQLSRAISFWPAAILTSALFGLFHIGNAGETPAGIASVIVFGLALAYSFRRGGALWFALGVHATWDYGETFVFGVPDSGFVAPGALSRFHAAGPVEITGGTVGPEGSWLVFVALALLILIARLALRRPTAAARSSAAELA